MENNCDYIPLLGITIFTYADQQVSDSHPDPQA
jgi:hypothetical protein